MSPSTGAAGWEAALDALEARLARQETAAVHGRLEGCFEAVELPSVVPGPADRVRARLALARIESLEREIGRVLARTPSPARSSPYN